MAENFKPWVETRLGDGRYLGWLTTGSGKVVAGAGMISSTGRRIRSILARINADTC